MLELNSVSKTYPGRNRLPVRALNQVSLVVGTGEFLTIVGPSGSGKSTMLFTAGAMLEPSEGTVKLGGVDIYSISKRKRASLRRRQIGFIFQTFNLIPYLTCAENVALPAVLDGTSYRDSRTRACEMLNRLGLGNRIGHRPNELSVGERQRVALCRSLVNEPDFLLADEPTGNLDDGLALEVIQMFLELNDEGLTIIAVTHDLRFAEMSPRILMLNEGEVRNDTGKSGLEIVR